MSKRELLFKHGRIKKVPEKWNLLPVGQACRIRNDLRKPISVEERRLIQGDYPYYGPTGVLDYINEFLVEGSFALIGEDGDHFLKPNEKNQSQFITGKFNVNNHAHIIETTDDCNAEWFSIYFKHRDITVFLTRQGANRYKLNKAALENLPILLPPLEEQKAIADLLSTWDRAISTTERLTQAKEKRFKWLLNKLINQNNSDWRKVKLGTILTESRISGNNGATAKKLTVKLYGKGVLPKNETRQGSATTKYYQRKAGQFIYSKLDFLNGAFGLIPTELNGYESTLDLPAFDVADTVSKNWLLYYFIRPKYYTRQTGLAKGQRKARRISPKELLNSSIPLPPLDEQKAIAETLNTAQHEIDLLKKLADKHKAQKRGLMQKLLTGIWRVNLDEITG
ncbi:restriction endonuclease subunit S [Pontiellaceae bacterium B12227]|nr:restriction endonuclease subunit S [Pontiellaceae bacterium B12227]